MMTAPALSFLRLAAALFQARGAAHLRSGRVLEKLPDHPEDVLKLAAAVGAPKPRGQRRATREDLSIVAWSLSEDDTLLVWSEKELAAPEASALEALRSMAPAQGEEAAREDPRLIGKSAAMVRVLLALEKIADSRVSVLIQGETGTGKEVLARELHRRSARAHKVFVSLNCSAISSSLLESELFGHTRGAFTGATEDRAGYFEQADGGSLFLDELQDMSPAMQRELLRVLQDGEILRVGAKRAIRVDVRVIAASNRNLKALVEDGLFRRDLFYRLNVVTIDLPPLRERREDIPALVDQALSLLSKRYKRPKPKLGADVLERLIQEPWPGNIRELQNLLEKSILMLEGETLNLDQLELDSQTSFALGSTEALFDKPYKEAKGLFLRAYLEKCLTRHNGNVTKAAEDAQILRSSFHKMLRKHGLRKPDGKQNSGAKVL